MRKWCRFKENNLKTLHFVCFLSFALYDYMGNVTRFSLLMIYKVCKIIIFYFLLFIFYLFFKKNFCFIFF